jgi:hypothetical protein
VRECTDLGSASGKIFPLHESVIRRSRAEWYSISTVIAAGADEAGASTDSAFKMEDVRGLELGACWLIMTAVFV